MLTETISGKCPYCGYGKLAQRYGSMGYFTMDACPNCGFGYGTNHYDGESFGEEAWRGYFEYLLDCWEIPFEENESSDSIRKKVFDKFEKEERYDDVADTVFTYTDEDIQKHKQLGLTIFNGGE